MLKFYHHFLSPQSRLVWIVLIERQIPCEIVSLAQESSLPVIEEDGVKTIEAFAILDYLDRYSTPTLLPEDAPSFATVQMVETVFAQLEPAVTALLHQRESAGKGHFSHHQDIVRSLTFLEQQLGTQQYFGGDRIIRADWVVGVLVALLPQLGVPLDSYPRLKAWAKRLTRRPSWTGTQMRLEEQIPIQSNNNIQVKNQLLAI